MLRTEQRGCASGHIECHLLQFTEPAEIRLWALHIPIPIVPYRYLSVKWQD